jgi:hypothetical protein
MNLSTSYEGGLVDLAPVVEGLATLIVLRRADPAVMVALMMLVFKMLLGVEVKIQKLQLL